MLETLLHWHLPHWSSQYGRRNQVRFGSPKTTFVPWVIHVSSVWQHKQVIILDYMQCMPGLYLFAFLTPHFVVRYSSRAARTV